ncbi:MAG: hypothetical protein ING25_09645 [Burkholderiales bacterium]|jgi:hypothetical protein|nr:hypothetical protein [Burkholderiales bacterium]
MTTSSINKTLQRAIAAESDGNLWRAKEIVQGRIASHDFDADVYVKMGQILLAMGDKLEAGKFFFISGKKDELFVDSIRLYLNRYSSTSANDFWATFPSRFKSLSFDDLPNSVREELLHRGYSPKELDCNNIKENQRDSNGALSNGALIIGLIILFLVGVVNGLLTILSWYR